MGQIQLLDQVTINKIAAGEVIDRPSSIVKELVENSLDAGSTEINVYIEDGGKKLIQISDNGHGISKEDLPIAPIRHSTSKIKILEDLYTTASFGFRGEALASISHAAELEITSKTKQDAAYFIMAKEDHISDPQKTHATEGTTIKVKHLFSDIPVRQKFLKSANTELSYITDIMMQFILLNPTIDFSLTHQEKEILNSKGIKKQEQLILGLFNKDLKNHLIKVEETIGAITVTGFISDPNFTFATRKNQFFSVNGRLISNATLKKAVEQSYRDIIVPKRFPLLALSLKMASDTVDVNIHPQKTDIKFLNPGFVFDALKKAIQAALQKHHLKQAPIYPSSTQTAKPLSSPLEFSQKTIKASDLFASQAQTNSIEEIKSAAPVLNSLFSPQQTENLVEGEYFQVCDTYLVIKANDGLWLMDQHAVHERILYEKFKTESKKENARQVLLLSEIIQLSPELYHVYEEYQASFAKLNFLIEPFGSNQIAVREIPTTFSQINLQDMLIKLLEQLQLEPNSYQDIEIEKKETLQLKACKAAIKAGKKLYTEEVKALVSDFIKSPSNFTCPHGRPLYIHFDKAKLEKLFLRT